MRGRPRPHLSRLAGIVIAVALMVPASRAMGGEERIAGLSVGVVGNGDLLVSGELIRWVNPTLLEDLNNGIPKDLYYTILLKKRQPAWFDEELMSKTIKHTIKYDVLKKQYSVTTRIDGQIAQKTVESFEEMAQLISRLDRVKMNPLKQLRARHTYYVSVKGEMRATEVPFYLEYIFFFVPALELDTPWADSAPFYALESPP